MTAESTAKRTNPEIILPRSIIAAACLQGILSSPFAASGLAQAMQADPAYFFSIPEQVEKDFMTDFNEDDLLMLYRSLKR